MPHSTSKVLLLAFPVQASFIARRLWGSIPRMESSVDSMCDDEDLPDVVDWTATNKVTPVEDEQDERCGACWAFAAAGAVESRWVLRWGGDPVPLSKQQLVDCTKSYDEQGCQGGTMQGVFEYYNNHGICTAASYPYEAVEGSCREDSCDVKIAAGTIFGSRDVKATEEELLCAVSLQPVVAAVVGEACPEFKNYTGGIINADHCGLEVDHGVLIVGYGTDVHGVDYWKVKNSWGTSWGEQGYARIARGRTSTTQLGIMTHASYPLIQSETLV